MKYIHIKAATKAMAAANSVGGVTVEPFSKVGLNNVHLETSVSRLGFHGPELVRKFGAANTWALLQKVGGASATYKKQLVSSIYEAAGFVGEPNDWCTVTPGMTVELMATMHCLWVMMGSPDDIRTSGIQGKPTGMGGDVW
jgi:hypothetical protein